MHPLLCRLLLPLSELRPHRGCSGKSYGRSARLGDLLVVGSEDVRQPVRGAVTPDRRVVVRDEGADRADEHAAVFHEGAQGVDQLLLHAVEAGHHDHVIPLAERIGGGGTAQQFFRRRHIEHVTRDVHLIERAVSPHLQIVVAEVRIDREVSQRTLGVRVDEERRAGLLVHIRPVQCGGRGAGI